MSSLELVVAIGVAVLVCVSLARRFGVAPPVLLLIAGLLLGFVPALRQVHLPPEAVLLLFLPVLLYWESFTSSLREIRSNLRVIVLMSTVLIALTAAGVAVTAHWLGLPWGPAWVLGAAVAPTDATAVGVLGKILPRRIAATLRAESLVNDGTALVIYTLAIGVTIGAEHFSVGRLAACSRSPMPAVSPSARRSPSSACRCAAADRRVPAQLLAVVTPLTAYLIAEAVEGLGRARGGGERPVGGPGVTAPVPGHRPPVRPHRDGFRHLAGQRGPLRPGRPGGAVGRPRLTSVELTRGVLLVACVSAVIVAVRFGWLFTLPYLIRAVDRRPQQRARGWAPGPER